MIDYYKQGWRDESSNEETTELACMMKTRRGPTKNVYSDTDFMLTLHV